MITAVYHTHLAITFDNAYQWDWPVQECVCDTIRADVLDIPIGYRRHARLEFNK